MNWESLPTIDATRIFLRGLSEEDVDALYTIFSDPEVMRYWSTPPLVDRNAASKLLSEIHDGFKNHTLLKWGIARRTDNALIGTATLFNLHFDNRRAEIGYGLGRAHWGNGYMQEALERCFSMPSKSLTSTESKPMWIREISHRSGPWSALGSSVKDICASDGRLTGRFKTPSFMAYFDPTGKPP